MARSAALPAAALAVLIGATSAAAAVPFTPGNLLVTKFPQTLNEYTPGGALVQSITVPWPTGNRPATEWVRDLVMTPDGRVHMYNGTFSPYLTTFDPIADTWEHRNFAGWSTVNLAYAGGLTLVGDDFVATDMKTVNQGEPAGLVKLAADATNTRFAIDPEGYTDVSLGLDGWIYALNIDNSGFVDVFDPISLQFQRTVELDRGNGGIAVDADGTIYGTSGTFLNRYSMTGQLLESFQVGAGTLTDIDLLPGGAILLGTGSEYVALADTGFQTSSKFRINSLLQTFVAPVVPEPGSILLAGTAGAWLLRRSRRRPTGAVDSRDRSPTTAS